MSRHGYHHPYCQGANYFLFRPTIKVDFTANHNNDIITITEFKPNIYIVINNNSALLLYLIIIIMLRNKITI